MPDSSMTTRVDKIFEKLDRPDSPGCALGVVKDGQLIYKRGYGMADLEHHVAITPSTVFNLASVSKQFTATAVVLLAQQNKLSLDDNVRKYVPELPDFGAPITLRHLIHHTSGLGERFTPEANPLDRRDDVLDIAARLRKLNSPPGEKHLYSSFGYSLLAVVVERVSGKSLREFAHMEIFGPLGMRSTLFFDNLSEIIENVARGYGPRAGGGFQRRDYNPAIAGATILTGASRLHSTVEDLARWDRNFYEDKIGRPRLVDQLLERGRLKNGEQLDYAFGLQIRAYRGLRVVEHGGNANGYRTHFMRFPEQRFSVALLCNAGNTVDPLGQKAREVAGVYLEKEFQEPAIQQPPPSAPVEQVGQLPQEQLENKVGLFWSSERRRRYRIFLKDAKLFLVRPDEAPEEPLELGALSENRFRVVQMPSMVFRFEMTTTGAPARLIQGRSQVYEAIQELSPTRDQLAEYAGVYLGDEIDTLFRVRAEEDKLVLSRPGSGWATLVPVLRDTFKVPYWYASWYLQFQRDSSGSVTGVVFSIGDGDSHFSKLSTQAK
jgi:CubicO group peptidase (beta-lactamase class C family)